MSAGDAPPPPLSLGDLLDQLCEIVRADPSATELPVTFGHDVEPVCGDIVLKDYGGRPCLNLAPVRLDQTGGF